MPKAGAKGAETVRVIVRARPMAAYEIEKRATCVVSFDVPRGGVTLTPAEGEQAEKREPKTFFFDAVYDWESRQRTLYDETVSPIVDSVLAGFNGTIFAYGQTGSGKTFTMEGKPEPELQGVIPNSFEHIFNRIATDTTGTTFLVRASYLEIYNEEVRDLLGDDPHRKLDLKQRTLPNGDEEVFVRDLTSFLVRDSKELAKIMEVGHSNRSVGRTDMNATSSRSHAIFTITIEAVGGSDAPAGSGDQHVRAGKLNLVDLAGSERQSKTKAEGIRLKEGAKINLSLVALGNVICALVDGTHVPYRDSKLTRLLQNSLGGSCKTVMIANISPASYNFDETLGTLRYADRAKNIKNTPKVNEDPKDALLREYQAEIKRLRELINARRNGLPMPVSSAVGDATPQQQSAVEGVSQELLEQLRKQKSEEVAKVLAERGYAEKEITRIQGQLKELEERTRRERRERAALERKLRMMEEKLVGGTKSLFDENQRQRALLEQQRLDLEQKRAEQERLARQLEQQKRHQDSVAQEVTGMRREATAVLAQSKEAYSRYKASRQELSDLQEAIQREREDLLDQIRELTSGVALRRLLVASFIPREEVHRAERRLVWNEDLGSWSLARLTADDLQIDESFVPKMSVTPQHQQETELAAAMETEQEPQAVLDMPQRPAQEYRPEVDELEAQIRAALREEDEGQDQQHVVLRASENLPNVFISSPQEFDEDARQQQQQQQQRRRAARGRALRKPTRVLGGLGLGQQQQQQQQAPHHELFMPVARRPLPANAAAGILPARDRAFSDPPQLHRPTPPPPKVGSTTPDIWTPQALPANRLAPLGRPSPLKL